MNTNTKVIDVSNVAGLSDVAGPVTLTGFVTDGQLTVQLVDAVPMAKQEYILSDVVIFKEGMMYNGGNKLSMDAIVSYMKDNCANTIHKHIPGGPIGLRRKHEGEILPILELKDATHYVSNLRLRFNCLVGDFVFVGPNAKLGYKLLKNGDLEPSLSMLVITSNHDEKRINTVLGINGIDLKPKGYEQLVAVCVTHKLSQEEVSWLADKMAKAKTDSNVFEDNMLEVVLRSDSDEILNNTPAKLLKIERHKALIALNSHEYDLLKEGFDLNEFVMVSDPDTQELVSLEVVFKENPRGNQFNVAVQENFELSPAHQEQLRFNAIELLKEQREADSRKRLSHMLEKASRVLTEEELDKERELYDLIVSDGVPIRLLHSLSPDEVAELKKLEEYLPTAIYADDAYDTDKDCTERERVFVWTDVSDTFIRLKCHKDLLEEIKAKQLSLKATHFNYGGKVFLQIVLKKGEELTERLEEKADDARS